MRNTIFYGKIQHFGDNNSLQITHKFNVTPKEIPAGFFIKLTKLSKRHIKKCKSSQDNFKK